MLKGNEIVSFPIYVWTNYKHFISDKELQVLGHMQLPNTGKKSWEIIADRIGYNSIKPLDTMMNKLVERQLVIRKGYEIDVSPLWDACRALWIQNSTQITPKQKPKKDYGIAVGIRKEFPHLNLHRLYNEVINFQKEFKTDDKTTFTVFTWAYRYRDYVSGSDSVLKKAILELLGVNIPEDDFKGILQYLYSWRNGSSDVEQKPFSNLLTVKNYNKWIEKGRPTEYSNAVDYSNI